MGDDFGVRFSDELVAFALQLFLEFEVIFDDAVVNDHDLTGAIAMRVGVFLGRAPVGGPAGVTDAIGALDGRFGDDFFKIAEFSGGAADFELAVLGDDSDACGVVATVFKLAQPFDDDGHDLFWPDVTDNSAHAAILLEMYFTRLTWPTIGARVRPLRCGVKRQGWSGMSGAVSRS